MVQVGEEEAFEDGNKYSRAIQSKDIIELQQHENYQVADYASTLTIKYFMIPNSNVKYQIPKLREFANNKMFSDVGFLIEEN